jgi:hypothetical protein
MATFKDWYEKHWLSRKEITPRTQIEYMNIGWNAAIESSPNKWTPTKISLPSEDGPYAVLLKDRECPAIRIWIGNLWFNTLNQDSVTHWLKLPDKDDFIE